VDRADGNTVPELPDPDDGLVDAQPTLSGRPAIATTAEPHATRVSRGTVVFAVILASAVVVAVVLVILRRGPEGVDVRTMAPGECYLQTDVVDDHGRPIPYGTDAPCVTNSPRVVAVVHLPLGPFPDQAALDRVAAERCGGVEGLVIFPTAESWLAGDRTVACIANAHL
jgi:hypothetical protein